MSKKAAKKSKHRESAAKFKGTHSKAADKSVKQADRSATAPSDSDAGGDSRASKTRARRAEATVDETPSERETKPPGRKARRIIPVPSPKSETNDGVGAGELTEDSIGFANSPFAADLDDEGTPDGDVLQVNERAKGKAKPAKTSRKETSKKETPKGKAPATKKEPGSNEDKGTKSEANVSQEVKPPKPVDDELAPTLQVEEQASSRRGRAKPKAKSKAKSEPQDGVEAINTKADREAEAPRQTPTTDEPRAADRGSDDRGVSAGGQADTKAKGPSTKASKKKSQSQGPSEDSTPRTSGATEAEDGAVGQPSEPSNQKAKKKRSKQAKQGIDAASPVTSTDAAGTDDGAVQDNAEIDGGLAAHDEPNQADEGSVEVSSEAASIEAGAGPGEGAAVGDEDAEEEDEAVLSLGDSQSEEDEEEEQLTEEEENQRYLKGIIEALLFASDKPLTGRELARAARIDKKRTLQLLSELRREYRHRGVNIVEVNGGFVLRSNPAYGAFVQKALALRPVKLSRAQLETLAIIAYRQPITRPEIDDIRGVDSGQVLKGLADRDLIKMVGKKDEAGRPMLYGTTDTFLELFNLDSLKGLPNLREFTELTEDSREKFAQATGETIPGPSESSDTEATMTDGSTGETIDGETSSEDGGQERDEAEAAELFAETESAEAISEQTPVPGETELEEEALDVELDAALATDVASSEEVPGDDVLRDDVLSDDVLSDDPDARNVNRDDEEATEGASLEAMDSNDADVASSGNANEGTDTDLEQSTNYSETTEQPEVGDTTDDSGTEADEFEAVGDETSEETNEAPEPAESASRDDSDVDEDLLSDDELK